eukprot:403336731
MEFADQIPLANETIIDAINIQRQKGEKFIISGFKYISLGMGCLALYGMFLREKTESLHFRVISPMIMCISALLMQQIVKIKPNLSQYMPFILNFIGMINVSERCIMEFPHQFKIAEPLFVVCACQEFFNNSLQISRKLKLFQQIMLWGYYLTRNFLYYNFFSPDFLGCTFVLIILSDLAAQSQDSVLKNIQDLSMMRQKEMKESFQNTLQVIPQGILVIDEKSKKICYANQEANKIFVSEQLNEMDAKLDQFKLKGVIRDRGSDLQLEEAQKNQSQLSIATQNEDEMKRVIELCEDMTLNEYLQQDIKYKKRDFSDQIYKIKKEPNPQYIVIKSNPIQHGTKLMLLINDISRIKQLEKISKRIRSMFFSSIAHELRTPLNSIIPISKELKKMQGMGKQANLFIDIVINSAHHLENVIEDALDMNRIENNKFEINNSMFNIREVVMQVVNIMKLQIEQKGLKIMTNISFAVPDILLCDQKRYKQILFNLIGNAAKFTFTGSITVKIDFQNLCLRTSIIDTGVGIGKEDLKKLFQFFGKIQAHKDINKGGMGLGLTISKMILNQMNGKISVKSELNKGSEFKFEIPIHEYKYRDEELKLSQDEDFHNNLFVIEEEDERFYKLNKNNQEDSKTIVTERIQSSPLLDDINNNVYKTTGSLNADYIEDQEFDELDVIRNFDASHRMNYSCNLENISRHNTNQQSFKSSQLSHDDNNRLEEGRQSNDNNVLMSSDQDFYNSNNHQTHYNSNGNNLNRTQAFNQKKLNILVVDDAPYNLLVMNELLKQIEKVKQIETALNGFKAVEMILSQENISQISDQKYSEFNYIFLDLHMPVQDGVQVSSNLIFLNIIFSRLY